MTNLRLAVGAAMLALVSASMAVAATPESQGVSSRAILNWLDACERELDSLHGFVLMRHGEVIAEGSWAPYTTLETPHMLYSHSKSFTSSAIGFLVDDGKLDLDERVIDIFPDKAPANPCENLRQLRVRDLITMNVGAFHTDAERNDINGDWEKAFLGNTFEKAPGTSFRYDSGATYMLAAIVERRSGMKLMDFLKARMFDKIGITKAWSTVSPSGTACGGWGMHMTTRELALFGQLYLKHGVWQGERVLSPEWVALATARQTWSGAIGVAKEDGSDWHQGYGFQFWRCQPSSVYRADGANGQLTVVMPEQDAVLSVHAGLDDMQKELSLVWEHLLPAFGEKPLPEAPQLTAALKARLAALALKPVEGDREGVERFCNQAIKTGHDRLREVKLVKTAEGLVCEITTGAGEYRLPVGFGEWKRGELVIDKGVTEPLGVMIGPKSAVATSAAITKYGQLKLRSWFLNGPHLMELTFIEQDGKVTLNGGIRGLGGFYLSIK